MSAAGVVLGFLPVRKEGKEAVLRLEACRQVCTGDAQIDEGAVLVLADQAMGLALRVVHDIFLPSLTMNMRVDWISRPHPGEAIESRGRIVAQRGDILLINADVSGLGGRLIASVNGQFLDGKYAGGFLGDGGIDDLGDVDLGSAPASFDQYLAVIPHEGMYRVEGALSLVGAPYLPSYHGGVIAAALQKAGKAWLDRDPACAAMQATQLTVNYLRPGNATLPLLMSIEPVKMGQKMTVLTVTARHPHEEKPVASAALCLVARADDREALPVIDL